MIDKLRSIWKHWVWGNDFRSVHLHVGDADKPLISGILLERKKDELSIKATLKATNALEELSSFGADAIPTVLVLTGKGIITKRIPRTVGGEDEQIKQQLAEYGNTAIVHSVSLQQHWLYISILRSEVLDAWLTRLSTLNVLPVHVELGIPAIWEAVRFSSGSGTARTGEYQVEFDENGMISYSLDSQPSEVCDVAGDQIEGGSLLSYAASIAFLRSVQSDGLRIIQAQEQRESAFYKRATKKLGMVAVASLFVVLMINAGLFMHFHDRQMVLESSMLEYQDKLTELESLKAELARKQEMAVMSGTSTNGRFAFYADQIAGSVASRVRLTRLTLNPIVKRKNVTDRLEVNPNVIEVEGVCNESEDMNDWVSSLRKLTMVEGLQITGFGKDEGSGQNRFSLELKMRS